MGDRDRGMNDQIERKTEQPRGHVEGLNEVGVTEAWLMQSPEYVQPHNVSNHVPDKRQG